MQVTDTARGDSLMDQEPTPVRMSWPVVAAGLAIVVALALGAAFLLNQRFGTRFGVQPVVAPTAVTTTTNASTTTAVAGAAQANAGATAAQQSSPSVDPALRDAVSRAYQQYWQVVAEAELNLDSSRLAEVMGGAELQREQGYIQDLRSRGRAVRTDVEHHATVEEASSGTAVVYDEYVDHSSYIDPTTKEPQTSSQQSTPHKVSYRFRLLNGAWKVVDGTRYE